MIRNQRNIALLFAVLFLQGMVFYSPVATLYRQESGLDLVQIGGIESFSLALMLLLELPWGWLADRLGHRRTIVLCAFVFAASKVVFWRAETFAAFLAERALLAVSLSGLSGCDSAFLFACCRDGGHRRAYALSQAVQTLGVLAASLSWPLWGGTYRLAALLTVGSYTAAALLTLGLAEPEGERAAQTRTAEPLSFAQAARRTLALAPVLLAFCLAEETGQSVTVFLSPLLYTRAGIPQQWFGALHAAMTAAGLLGGLSHRMSRRLGQRRAAAALLTAGTAACLLPVLSPAPAAAVLGVTALRAVQSLLTPLSLSIQNERAHPTGRAAQLSCNAMLMDVGSMCLYPAFGALAGQGVERALLLGAACCCAAALVLFGAGAGQPAS